MTITSLEKGQLIRDYHEDLKRQLFTINSKDFFDISDSANRCTGRSADPFLAQLNIELKQLAIQKITDRINELNEVFEKL